MKTWKQETIIEFADKVKSFGYSVYLAESEEYGFWVTKQNRIISFQTDSLSGIAISGEYKPVNHMDGKKIGTGWRIATISADKISPEIIEEISHEAAPYWAIKDKAITYPTLEEHLARYQSSSKYKLI